MSMLNEEIPQLSTTSRRSMTVIKMLVNRSCRAIETRFLASYSIMDPRAVSYLSPAMELVVTNDRMVSVGITRI